jgi:hypothetical protein
MDHVSLGLDLLKTCDRRLILDHKNRLLELWNTENEYLKLQVNPIFAWLNLSYKNSTGYGVYDETCKWRSR